MIKRENFPICAQNTAISMQWTSTGVDDLQLAASHLTFDNVNVTSAGNIKKERTSLPFDLENPIEWADEVPQAIKDAFNSPGEAIRYALGALYESDRHQYLLGTKQMPVTLPEDEQLDEQLDLLEGTTEV